ncbi:hypothetical protein Hamer_G013553 [Homarus americanus]|uniref:Uncharacterized protein n=1 Tax=Homarus americanus TaxID=6706 RepID=A0A8J5N117_HOMAM|nr:hypothetical protein Hamer_G013553 [Homarus americanus]
MKDTIAPNISEEARLGHITCNIWGWVTLHGLGDVFIIEGRFTEAKCIQLLEERSLSSLRARNFPFPAGPVLFIHDRSSIRTARVVHHWLQEQDPSALGMAQQMSGHECH